MALSSGINAAQYVRMSTEDQQYSIANQKDAIQKYAANHGYTVVSTYEDTKSGVAIKTRDGLRQLLRDVVSGLAQFQEILVYDVSRWGRFQDLDEAAHYEFVCKSAGIPVRYCAEQFPNDNTLPSAIMKALKRTMAAEYSRELGVKVLTGQYRLARMGFRMSGAPGLGLRRMIVSEVGRRKLLLKKGERKALRTDHMILVPGPKKEVATVRQIFRLASNRHNSPRKIAEILNQRNTPRTDGAGWDEAAVYRILKNEKYIGCNVFGKTTKRLSSPSRKVPIEQWAIAPDAFTPIVDQKLFHRVQKVIQRRRRLLTDEDLLKSLKRVLEREGELTEKVIKGPGIFSHDTYCRRFGSMMRAYELVGYVPSKHAFSSVVNQLKINKLRAEILARLRAMFPDSLRIGYLRGRRKREVVEFEGQVPVAIHICRPLKRTVKGQPRWLLRIQPSETDCPSLICIPDKALTTALSLYVMPAIGRVGHKYKVLGSDDEWLSRGRKLEDLSQLQSAVTAIAGGWQESGANIVLDDVVISSRVSTITIGRKEVILCPVNIEIFKLLVANAGAVVRRERLFSLFQGSPCPSPCLNAHISELRKKLGPQFRQRIQTIKGVGYRYEVPAEVLGAILSRHDLTNGAFSGLDRRFSSP